jgi:hypothetical protein
MSQAALYHLQLLHSLQMPASFSLALSTTLFFIVIVRYLLQMVHYTTILHFYGSLNDCVSFLGNFEHCALTFLLTFLL